MRGTYSLLSNWGAVERKYTYAHVQKGNKIFVNRQSTVLGVEENVGFL